MSKKQKLLLLITLVGLLAIISKQTTTIENLTLALPKAQQAGLQMGFEYGCGVGFQVGNGAPADSEPFAPALEWCAKQAEALYGQ